jgi:hypothetical protein
MKKFIVKSIFFFLLIISIFILYFILALNIKLNENVSIINESSIYSSEILILGDSRAERQIDPMLLNKITGKKCLNIAQPSMDLYSLSKRLKKIKIKNKILIISASSWQINDGSTSEGYFRTEAFNDLTPYQKLKLYSTNIVELIKLNNWMVSNIFSDLDISIGKENRLINQGYGSIDCNEFETVKIFPNHPWYRKINTLGIKRNLLVKALTDLNKLNCRIIIYNAPVYLEFKEIAIKNGAWEMENNYAKTFSEIVRDRNLNNITFYDLRNLSGFTKNDFYDPQHFCKAGAKKFTKKIVSLL